MGSRLAWRTWCLAALLTNGILLLVWSARRCFASDLHALVATITDDSFYYVLPAYRFWEHGSWTFDGEHATFGVQPVYAWFLTALAAFFDDRFLFFRAALWSNYLFFAATAVAIAVYLQRLLRPCGAFRASVGALLGAHGFLLNGTLLHGYTTLKENSLYALLLVLSLGAAHRANHRSTWRTLALFGFVTGLAISCRITPSTFLIAAATAVFAAHGLRPSRLLVIAGGAAMAVLPWALHALAVHGRLLPTSGSVKAQPFVAAARHGQLDERLPGLLAEVGPYLADVLAYSLGRSSAFSLPQGAPASNVLTMLFPCLFAGLVLAGRRSHALRVCPGAWLVFTALVAALLGTATNPVLLGIERMAEVRTYYTWYLADLPVLLALAAPLAATFAPREPSAPVRHAGRWAFAGAALAAALVLSLLSSLRSIPVLDALAEHPGSWHTQSVAITRRANELLGPGARIGAYNAGVVGFLSDGDVVNFDGLANDDLLAARGRGTTILEYVQQNEIRYVIDPLRPTGWFGNAFDRLEFVAGVPFQPEPAAERREYHDGYFLLRVVDERFPDFEPAFERNGVRVVPWAPVDPLGTQEHAVRCFRFEPRDGAAVLTFHTLRAFAAVRFRVGREPTAAEGGEATLSLLSEEGRLLHRSAPDGPELVTVPFDDVDRVRLEVTATPAADGSIPVVWLTDASFDWGSHDDGEEVIQTYGEGCNERTDASAARPHLGASGDPSTGRLRYVVRDAPPRSEGTLAIGTAPISKELAGGCRALVERTSGTILLQMATDDHGHAEREVTIPSDAPAGSFFAQVVFRDPDDPRKFYAATNGVRARVRR